MRFLDRLREIIDMCISSNLGKWKQNGTVFFIYDVSIFEKCIKPYVLNTFKRQLNLYHFTATKICGSAKRFYQ